MFFSDIYLKQKMAVKSENPIKPPVTFKQFVKEPIKALLFISVLAIGYLYVDLKLDYTGQIKKESSKVEKLEIKIEQLTEQVRKSDSTLSGVTAKLNLLQELGKIK
jgi:hypothetical protein